MSLDLSNTSGSLLNSIGQTEDDFSEGFYTLLPPIHHHASAAYVGFSAQSHAIPSIACDSDISLTPSLVSEIVSRLIIQTELNILKVLVLSYIDLKKSRLI